MTLIQLRYLVAIVDADLRVTHAAERMNATQPGLSKQLKSLEEELGFQIFVRRGKSLDRLSAAGELVVARARTILDEAANIRTLAANHRGEQDGELVIATTETQARLVLPAPLKSLRAAYPRVSVRLNLFSDAERARTAREGADILIASAIERPQTSDLIVPLYGWNRLAIVPTDHPLAQRRGPLQLADLAAYPLIGYESALGSHASVAQAFAAAGAPAQFAYTAHDPEVIKTFVRSGLGVGLLAEMADGGAEDLLSLPVGGLPSCTTYALLARDKVTRTYVIDFLASLAPHVARRDITRALQPGGQPLAVAPPARRQWLAAAPADISVSDAA